MAVTFGISPGRDGDANAQATEFKTHNDLLLDVANLVPEFGGMFLSDDNSILHVYVTSGWEDATKRQDVKQAIENVFGVSITRGREVQLIPSEYSMLHLHEWYIQMQDVVWRNPNVVSTDLQEGKNRIEVDVDTREAVEAVKASLAPLDIPDGAVAVQVGQRFSFTSEESAPVTPRTGAAALTSAYAALLLMLGLIVVAASLTAAFVLQSFRQRHKTRSSWTTRSYNTR